VQLQIDEQVARGEVRRCALGPDGTVVGSHNDNPMLNSIVCAVEFPDGQDKECAANVIAENMLSQIDSEGCSATLMEGIVDFKKDDTTLVSKNDMHVVTK